MTAPPPFSEFLGGLLLQTLICSIRIYLNCNVNNMWFIVYSHYKNTSIRLCEEYKRSLTIRILRCRDQGRTKFWIFLSVTVWGFILFRYYYKFYIAANPSSLGVFLHICIICRYIPGLRKKSQSSCINKIHLFCFPSNLCFISRFIPFSVPRFIKPIKQWILHFRI